MRCRYGLQVLTELLAPANLLHGVAPSGYLLFPKCMPIKSEFFRVKRIAHPFSRRGTGL